MSGRSTTGSANASAGRMASVASFSPIRSDPRPEGCEALLEIESDDEFMWGDAGSLYLSIDPNGLAAGRLSDV